MFFFKSFEKNVQFVEKEEHGCEEWSNLSFQSRIHFTNNQVSSITKKIILKRNNRQVHNHEYKNLFM